MKRSLNELINYSVEAIDTVKGSVKDFLFEEDRWVVRYLEADLGMVFSGKKVLIPKMFLRNPQWNKSHFPIALTSSDIERCPELEEHLPVSRAYEQKLNRSYRIENYWNKMDLPPIGATGITFPPRPIKVPSTIISKHSIKSHLRSFKEVKGYTIHALDGKLGHIEDMIIDDEDWQISYLVVDTKYWQPWSKRVLIGIEKIIEVCYTNLEVVVELNIDDIKTAPDFHYEEPINEIYEKRLYDYYGRRVTAKM